MTLTLQTFTDVLEARGALTAPGARYIGGGTLVVRATNEGDVGISRYVRAIDPTLRAIEVSDERVRIGASTTMAAAAAHPGLAAIASAARAIGGPAVRNMATVGGNLFAEAPYGDFTAALLALDAEVEIDGGTRTMEAFLADRDTLPPGAIVTGVRFAPIPIGVFRFLKVARVKPKGVSVLTIAAVLTLAANGAVASARIALGCAAPRPIRARAAEAALTGRPLTREGVAPAVAVIREGTAPPTDAIASAWYRGEVLPVHFARLLLG